MGSSVVWPLEPPLRTEYLGITPYRGIVLNGVRRRGEVDLAMRMRIGVISGVSFFIS
jgi:hypothetical protein